MAATQSNMTMEDELRNAFNVFDKDGSGYISSEELKQVIILISLSYLNFRTSTTDDSVQPIKGQASFDWFQGRGRGGGGVEGLSL